MGTTKEPDPVKKTYQDQIDLVQVDWDGNIVWKFDKTELIADGDKDPVIWPDSIMISSEKDLPLDIIIRAGSRRQTVEIH